MGFFSDNAGGFLDLGNNILSQGIAYFRDMQNRNWQEEMWNKQNEYNLPVNQRKRLEEAGINPNLAFGSSASAMGGTLPSSPSSHVPQTTLGEFWLRKKQVEAQVRQQEASTRREDQITEQLRMNNEVMSALLNDKIITERGDLYVQRILQGWKEDNLRHSLDVGLQSDEFKRDVEELNKKFVVAKTTQSVKAAEALQREMDHLSKKYGFEEQYYNMGLNPYETSTPMGILRYFYGAITSFLRSIGVNL